jgi:hypothetical protein
MIEDYDSARVTASSDLDRKRCDLPAVAAAVRARWTGSSRQSLALIEAIG